MPLSLYQVMRHPVPELSPDVVEEWENLEKTLSHEPTREASVEKGESSEPSDSDDGEGSGEVEPPERCANAVLVEGKIDTLLDRWQPIRPSSVFRLRLNIGEVSAESAVEEPEPLPEHLLPEDIWLEVMVSSTHFEIGHSEADLGHSNAVHGRLFLPRDGGPATAPDGSTFLYFHMRAPTEPQKARARISFYFRNHLVQSYLLRADIGVEEGSYSFKPDYTLSASLTGLKNTPKRPQVSIVTNDNGSGHHQIVVRSADGEGNVLGKSSTYELDESTVGSLIGSLRTVLRDQVATAKETRQTKRSLVNNLRALAPLGWQLWSATVAQCLHPLYEALKEQENVVIQIARPTTASYTFPWSLVYDIPLHSDTKPQDLQVCPLVESWDEKAPLIQQGLHRCPETPDGLHEPDTLCPFGFWGYRYPIEQLASTDRPILKISVPANAPFEIATAQTQYRVNTDELEAHTRELKEVLQSQFPQATLLEGKDKTSIHSLLGRDLPLVYFYCHGERTQYGDPNTHLGVGQREQISAGDFAGWVLDWYLREAKKVWDQMRPLVFVNACHALEINPDTLVSYLDVLMGTAHAAGVIGPEVKVRQSQAMAIALDFFRQFFEGETVAQALHHIRLDYLAAGNLYGLLYTPYCWSDLRLISQ
jgi:hypothetical protein